MVKITRNSDNSLANLKIVQLVPCRLDRFDFFRNIASFNKRQRLTGECDDIGHFQFFVVYELAAGRHPVLWLFNSLAENEKNRENVIHLD